MAFIEIEGRLGNDPEGVTTEKSSFTALSVAENKNFFDSEINSWAKQRPNWFDVVCFGKIGERAALLKKGDKILVKGSIDQIKKNKDGKSQYQLSISARSLSRVETIGVQFDDGIPFFDSKEEIHF